MQAWLPSTDKLAPVPEEDIQSQAEVKLPDFKVPLGLNKISRSNTDGYRIE
jgi:hypothetical protein